NCSFCWLNTSLPRSTHSVACSRAWRARLRIYSRLSSALERRASRVSLPERGAYSMPTTAPKPNPARNHPRLVPSLSDINFASCQCLTYSDVSTHFREIQFLRSDLQPCGSRNNANLRQQLGHSNHHETGANRGKGNGMRDSMRGFTLIELLIVIAIILIIAAMAIPNLLHSRIAA